MSEAWELCRGHGGIGKRSTCSECNMFTEPRLTWQQYGINLANAVKQRSEDKHLQVGAVVFRNDMSVASVGYNGAPSGIEINWNVREQRRPFVIHAEANALRYVTVADTTGGMLTVTHYPCSSCLTLIAAYKFDSVVFENYLDTPDYPREKNENIARQLKINIQQVHGKGS